MTPKEQLLDIIRAAYEGGCLKKIIFSKPGDPVLLRMSGRLCSLKGQIILSLQTEKKDGKALHRNLTLAQLDEIADDIDAFAQINIICLCNGKEISAEYRKSAKGKSVLLGGDKLIKMLSETPASFVCTTTLDRQKNYILDGTEPFLRELDIADANGRIHDKKQAKFRQINRFLEHIRDVLPLLPQTGTIRVYDLCCGKSYLSFAVYHYLHHLCGREVDMLGMDLKQDCMDFCTETAQKLGFSGMRFACADVRTAASDMPPDLVLSLHACDIATDIVLHFAARVRAKVILSTPCCHHDLKGKIAAPSLRFVSDYPQLDGKLSEALTDALRLARLRAHGYRTVAMELTDPENTPKNTLLRAVLDPSFRENSRQAQKALAEYRAALAFVFGNEDITDYPQGILS